MPRLTHSICAQAVVGILSLVPTSALALTPNVAMVPSAPFLERRPGGDAANFDILVHNARPAPTEITEIDVAYLDRDRRVLIERRADENGTAPSIDTLGALTVPPGKTQLYFNPFPRFPPDVHPDRVRVRVTIIENRGKPGEVSRTEEAAVAFRAPPESGTKLVAPLNGHVLVWDGHDAMSHHRRWNYMLPTLAELGYATNGMRYSYDFVRVDEAGRRFAGVTDTHQRNYSFGVEVRGPADGVVVETESAQPDDGSADLKTFKARPNLMFGNYVVIKIADDVFALLGHLRKGSVRVRVGERVRAGETIAAVGNSGTSLFPHVHFQLMTGPGMAHEGVPSAFAGVTLVRGERRSENGEGQLDSGDVADIR